MREFTRVNFKRCESVERGKGERERERVSRWLANEMEATIYRYAQDVEQGETEDQGGSN